ncbi:MAG: DUF305 domain-containing protein [Gemmatimonadaceae bacterium]
MMLSQFRAAAGLVVAVVLGACAHAAGGTAGIGGVSTSTAVMPSASRAATPTANDLAFMAKASRDSSRYPYTAADIQFVSGMISHHAQAIKMASMAPSHGAAQSVRTLCDRIINAQGDEIRIMQQWLRDRRQEVPDANPNGMTMMMNGMPHTMLMPGMLTEEQMNRLDAARGTEFDRLFLSGMIQHHQGAIAMVKELLDSYGAAQDEWIAKFSQDVNVDQSTEIVRMQQMLAYVTLQGHAP